MTATEITKREILFEKQKGKCFYCDKQANQFAHILGQTELNYKLYGRFVIDSIHNGVMTCSTECNRKADIGKLNMFVILEHIIGVYQKELDKRSK